MKLSGKIWKCACNEQYLTMDKTQEPINPAPWPFQNWQHYGGGHIVITYHTLLFSRHSSYSCMKWEPRKSAWIEQGAKYQIRPWNPPLTVFMQKVCSSPFWATKPTYLCSRLQSSWRNNTMNHCTEGYLLLDSTVLTLGNFLCSWFMFSPPTITKWQISYHYSFFPQGGKIILSVVSLLVCPFSLTHSNLSFQCCAFSWPFVDIFYYQNWHDMQPPSHYLG